MRQIATPAAAFRDETTAGIGAGESGSKAILGFAILEGLKTGRAAGRKRARSAAVYAGEKAGAESTKSAVVIDDSLIHHNQNT